MARPPLARPTDAPPIAHAAGAEPSDRGRGRPAAGPARRRPRTCRVTSRSSWTATGAGPATAACPSSRATPPASRRSAASSGTPSGAASRSSRCTPSAARTGPARRRGQRPVRAARGAIRSETAGAPPRRACGSASSAGSTSCPTATRRRSAGPRGDGRRRPAHAQRRVQLLRADGARRRVPAVRRERDRGRGDRRGGRSPAALYTAGLPDPDLVIRTGGEQRISNFLIWQAAYAELYFSELLWPDFGADALRRGAGGVRPPITPLRPLRPGRAMQRARAQRRASSSRRSSSSCSSAGRGSLALIARRGRARGARGVPAPAARRATRPCRCSAIVARRRVVARGGAGRPATAAALLLVASASILVGGRRFREPDPREGLADLGRHGVRRACTSSLLGVRRPARPSPRRLPADAPLAASSAPERGWSCCSSWPSGPTTPAPTSSASRFGADASS